MNQGKYVFSQLMSLISHKVFNRCVSKYKGDYKSKHFTCWKQFLCMSFGQLTHRESLSDTIVCLQAHADKLYHLGIGQAIVKSTLSNANEGRDYRIFQDIAMTLITEAKALYVGESDLEVELKSNVFAIDATIIDVCLSAFSWAKFRSTKGGIKVHLQLDLKTAIPEFIHITPASVHEVNILEQITYQRDSFYVVDRGYTAFEKLYAIQRAAAFFIIRAKDNLNFCRLSSRPVNKAEGVLCDQIIRLCGFYARKDYPARLRRIKFYDAENNRTLVFLSNNFDLKATEIAQLYKHRWKIELFFKWIKQHLKVKSFWGRSENAVKVQIWIAIAVYVLVAIAKKKLGLKQTLYQILQVVSIGIFDKTPIQQLFKKPIQQNFKELNHNQLKIFN
ncbi:IS4 family transposase [Microcoleus sp. AT8-B6]|uniref:IS4 family transposase n=1 Tax=Microcoleus sp. AT8-B6 TaxID=2818622 RepID=UPI002FD5B93B